MTGHRPPRPVTPEAIDRGLAASAKFVNGCARLFHDWAVGFMARTNELPRFAESATKRSDLRSRSWSSWSSWSSPER